MRLLIAMLLLAFLLAACSQPAPVESQRPDIWLASISGRNSTQFNYSIVECSDAPLYQGVFVPFEVSVDHRNVTVSSAPFVPINDSCVNVTYVLSRALREDLLGKGTFTVTLDPAHSINESDRANDVMNFTPSRVCIDGDGDNPFLSSFVTASIKGESVLMLDRCENSTATEFTCTGSGGIQPVTYRCKYGCVGGSCRCPNSATCLVDGSAKRVS